MKCLSKFKTEVIPSIFSDHRDMKLEIETRGNFENLQTHEN